MKTAIILQARTGSTRLPSKVLKKILDTPMIKLQIDRLLRVDGVDEIILATTTNVNDDSLIDLAKNIGIKYYRGPQDDVLTRFAGAAQYYNIDNIIRCNADCPLIDPKVIERVLTCYLSNMRKYDYVSNILVPTFPVGMHTEVFSRRALLYANEHSIDPDEREHVTPYIYRRPDIFKLKNVFNDVDLSSYRLTVDYDVDLAVVDAVFSSLYCEGRIFSMKDVVDFLNKNPQIKKINSSIIKKSTI